MKESRLVLFRECWEVFFLVIVLDVEFGVFVSLGKGWEEVMGLWVGIRGEGFLFVLIVTFFLFLEIVD